VPRPLTVVFPVPSAQMMMFFGMRARQALNVEARVAVNSSTAVSVMQVE
jgi:hypothetical protein